MWRVQVYTLKILGFTPAWIEGAHSVKTVYFYTAEGALSYMAIDTDGDLSTLADQYVTSKTIYDEYGRKTESIIDHDGNLITTSDQTAPRYVYDNQGRVVKTTYADNALPSVAYDKMGRKTTHYEYDSQGRLTAVILPQAKHPLSGEMEHVHYEYGYNKSGNQTNLRDNIYQTNPKDSRRLTTPTCVKLNSPTTGTTTRPAALFRTA